MYCKEILSLSLSLYIYIYIYRADRSGRAVLLPERNAYAAANAVHSLGEGQWGGECRTRKKAPSDMLGRGFFPVF